MPINISNYVDITSGIGGASEVSTRSLGAMIISQNPLVPSNAILTFEDANDVGSYFGFASGEYARAVFYFGWVSKNITSVQTLSFWFWNNDAATGSLIYGLSGAYAVAQFTSITTGDFSLTMGGTTQHITGVNFSSDASLAAVAATLQTAIRAVSAGGTAFTGATVSYDATNNRFDLVSGATGNDTISVAPGVTTDISAPLGWSAGAIFSNGTAAQLIAASLAALVEISNNFGSICFGNPTQTLANITAAANWNNSLTPNIQFMFSVQVSVANASAWSAALLLIGGLTLTLASPVSGEFPEMVPMTILAATDYSQINAVQNYSYNQFNLTSSVTNDANKTLYDGLRINYIGQTQTAGQLLQFYQTGVMMGTGTNPLNQNIYANEIWFKDAIAAACLNLLLGLPQLPTNNSGRAQLISTIQSVVNQALDNGTIEVGKQLSTQQILYINQITGSPTAWQQVQNAGYWLTANFVPVIISGVTQYKAVYTLVYSKDDTVFQIVGRDVLI